MQFGKYRVRVLALDEGTRVVGAHLGRGGLVDGALPRYPHDRYAQPD